MQIWNHLISHSLRSGLNLNLRNVCDAEAAGLEPVACPHLGQAVLAGVVVDRPRPEA